MPLLPTGYVRRSLTSILNAYQSQVEGWFGNFLRNPDSYVYRLFSTIAAEDADVSELGEQIYQGTSLASATGTQLDEIGLTFANTLRLNAQPTTVTVTCLGAPGAVITAGQNGTILRAPTIPVDLYPTETVTLGLDRALAIQARVLTPATSWGITSTVASGSVLLLNSALQAIQISGPFVTSNSITVTVNGQTTSAIPFTTNTATTLELVRAATEALSSVAVCLIGATVGAQQRLVVYSQGGVAITSISMSITGGSYIPLRTVENATSPEIAVRLAALLTPLLDSGWSITAGTVNSGQTGTLTILGDTAGDPAAFAMSSPQIAIDTVYTPVEFRTDPTGPFSLATGTVTQIVTPVTGLDEVNNFVVGVTGRNVESDAAYRRRIGFSRGGRANRTRDAVLSRLYSLVPNIVSVGIFENVTNATVGDLPPHSIKILIEGGADDDIAAALYQVVAAGIQTVGTEDVTYTNEDGFTYAFSFSRVELVPIFVNITLSGSGLPVDTQAAVRDAIVAATSGLEVGQEVLIQLLYGPIYSVTGVTDVSVLEIGVSVLGTSNISVFPYQRAVFLAENITVVVS